MVEGEAAEGEDQAQEGTPPLGRSGETPGATLEVEVEEFRQQMAEAACLGAGGEGAREARALRPPVVIAGYLRERGVGWVSGGVVVVVVVVAAAVIFLMEIELLWLRA